MFYRASVKYLFYVATLGLVVSVASSLTGCGTCVCDDCPVGYDVSLIVENASGDPVQDADVNVTLYTANGPLQTTYAENPLYYLGAGVYSGEFLTEAYYECAACGMIPLESVSGPPDIVSATITIDYEYHVSLLEVVITDEMIGTGLPETLLWLVVEVTVDESDTASVARAKVRNAGR